MARKGGEGRQGMKKPNSQCSMLDARWTRFIEYCLLGIFYLPLVSQTLRAQTTNPYPMRNIVLMLPATYAGEGFEAAHFDPRVRDGTLYLWPRADTGGGTNTINGITNLNGQTVLVQTFATGTAGTDFAIASAAGVHTWNLPTASAANRGALSTADWTTFNNKQASITWQTQGVTLATAPTTVNWTTGVTGYVSGATALLGVSAAGSSTNALVQTNGVNVGSIGTLNFIGATGAVISGVATIGGFGGSSTTTNFVVTAHGAITVTNGIYSGIAGTSGRIYSWDDTFGDYWQLFFIDDSQFKIGESGLDTSIFGSTIALRAGTIYPMPEASGLYTQLGVPTQRYSLAWFGPTGLFAGRLSLTNYPGEGNPSLEWRDTNGQGYTRIQRTNNANIKDTNVWWMSFNNPSAGQVRKIHSVTWDAAGVAHIVETNAADNTGGAGSSVFNINQFSASATHTNIKDGALVTNMVSYGFTNNGAISNSGAAFLGGFLDAKGPNTNRVQLNLPHLTASRSAVINAQGDVTNSSAASNWSLYDTNLLFGAAGNSGDVQFNQSGVLAGTNRVVWNRTNENLVVRGVSSGLVFGTNFGIYIEDVLTLATNTIGPTHIGQRGNVDFSLVTSNVLRWTVNGDGTLYPRSSDNGTMDLGTSSSAVRTQFVNHVNVGTAIHGRTSNAVPSGAFLFPWNTNFANRVQAKEGVSWGNDGAAYYTLEATNAVKTTNIMRYSLTNPVAGQIYKFHSVENLSGGQVIITVTNDVDNSGGAGAGILTNANQFGAAGATVTVKDYPYITNVTDFATSRVQTIHVTNYVLIRAGQSTSNANAGGVMWFDTANYTNCCGGAVLTNMNQYTVPAHTLTNNGDSLRWWIAGRTAFGLASTNRIAVIFGSQAVMDTGLQIRSNCQWTATGSITRTGNTSQRIESTLWWPGPGGAAIMTNIVTDIAQTNGIDTVLKMQGASRRTAVLTNMMLKVTYEPRSL